MMRKETKIGLILFSAMMLIRYLFPGFDFLHGVLAGLAILLLILGLLPESSYGRLKAFKRRTR